MRRFGQRRAVEARGDLLGQEHLRVLGVAAGFDLALECGDLGTRAKRQQRVVLPHQLIADRQQLGKHRVRRLGDADVVALALGHLLHAIQPLEQGHRQDALRLLPVLALQGAAHQQIELLIGAAEFEV